jgi:hypothetical protein
LRNEDESRIAALLGKAVNEPPGTGGWLGRFGSPGSGAGVETSGVPVRSGRQVELAPHVSERRPSEIYPFLWPPMTSVSPMSAPAPTAPAEVYVQKLEFRDGALNGFAACHNRRDANGYAINDVDPAWKLKRHVFAVDAQPVRTTHGGPIMSLAPSYVFERDAHVFIRFSTGL